MSSPGALDIANGWSLFTGIGGNTQPGLAQQFYTAVTGIDFPTDGHLVQVGDVILTGHSLGGGLAGYVGAQGWQQAVVFDPIPYAQAALENVLSRAMAATVSALGLTWENVAPNCGDSALIRHH